MEHESKVFRFIVFTIISFILFLGIGELVARTVPIRQFEPCFSNPHRSQLKRFVRDPVMFWRLRPGNKADQVNYQGFRGDPLANDTVSNRFLIACLGDSTTFGIGGPSGIPVDQAYPAILEKLLRENVSPDVRVINLGVPGYSSFQGLLYLNEILPRFSPSLVIFSFGTNDSLAAQISDDRQLILPELSMKYAKAYDAINRLYLTRHFTSILLNAREKAAMPTMRVIPRKYDAYTKQAAANCASAGCRILFIPPACLDEKGEVVRDERYVAEPMVDPVPALKALARQKIQPIFPDDKVHLTVQGHLALATLLAERIGPMIPNRFRE